MKQLPLPVKISQYMTFESFFIGRNSELIEALKDEGQRLIWIAGESGNGKTHLLSSLCNEYDSANKRIQYLNMEEAKDYSPEIIDGLEALDLIAIDAFDSVAGEYSWEEKFMHLYESILNVNTRLIIASKNTPKGLDFKIPDLESRFSLGLLFRINPLDDDELVTAIQLHANARGFELPKDSAKFIIKRTPRSVNSLIDILNILDYESLSSQRKLTIPFVKSILKLS
ncbi:MAG: DnaA regulatory inactivator Hda [Gammaproteobacteria bacterium]|nr:DnaA regulatory inactivator Hda [Gammaproteobacteria bacterium]